MSQKAIFNYYYGQEADMYTFYRIPKLLFTHEYFRELSSDAKILYGLMLDRMSLSIKNEWFDEQNRAYIYFSVEDIMELLNCGKNKAVKTLQELDSEQGIGLIEKRRQGFSKANVIYVKSFVLEEIKEQIPAGKQAETEESDSGLQNKLPEVYKSNFKEFTNQTSRIPKSKPLEVYKSNPNYNNTNNTYESNIKSNQILSDAKESTTKTGLDCDMIETDIFRAYEEIIKENIEYDILLTNHPYEVELIEGIFDLIVETVMSKTDTMIIASNQYPSALVKSKFMKLKSPHIEYVLERFQHVTAKIKNIKKYLLAALFNAPSTISGYYQAEVHHDMPELAR